MNKHEEARNELLALNDKVDKNAFQNEYGSLDNYIYNCEQNEKVSDETIVYLQKYVDELKSTEKAYEELKRDVKRCIMIDRKIIFHTASHDEVKDCELLKIKLSKVGVEND